jgi:putative sigma-54 modulation protein
MKIQVRGDHIPVTQALQDYAERKIGRLVKYFNAPPERNVLVTMSVERGIHRVEVTFTVHGVLFRAEESSQDMYASIDLVADKLELQILRYKEKVNERFRQKGLRTRIKAVTDNVALANGVMEEEADVSSRIVRTKRFAIKPMNVEEAVLQMDLLNHDFYVFQNAETDEVNVVYRRRNGDYGLIEPTYE